MIIKMTYLLAYLLFYTLRRSHLSALALIPQNENLETPETFNLNFLFQVVKGSTYRCQRNDANNVESNKSQII